MAQSTSEAKCAVAVRYLLKRSQRFGDKFMPSMKRTDNENSCEKPNETNDSEVNKERLIERLRKLGLAPRKYSNPTAPRSSSSKRKRQHPKKLTKVSEDDGFVQPRVFECDYCPRIFFNKTIYRRHTIKHLRIRRCEHCNQPFKARVSHRRHQANCKRKIF